MNKGFTMSGRTDSDRSDAATRTKSKAVVSLFALALLATGVGMLTGAATPAPEETVIVEGEAAVVDTCPNPAPWWCERASEDYRCLDGPMAYRGCVEVGF